MDTSDNTPETLEPDYTTLRRVQHTPTAAALRRNSPTGTQATTQPNPPSPDPLRVGGRAQNPPT
eukprot:6136920-Alexandrium_andersonii.AAC.1